MDYCLVEGYSDIFNDCEIQSELDSTSGGMDLILQGLRLACNSEN